MRHVLVAASLAFLAPSAPRAEGSFASRFTVSLRAGYALPAGSSHADPSSGEDEALSDAFGSQIPLQIEVAYRLTERFAAGAYASYGFDQVGRAVRAACSGVPATCSAATARVGVQAFYLPGEVLPRLSPWFALGAGWEWSEYSRPGALVVTFGGPEIASVQAGADWRAARWLSLGPYLQGAVGRFLSVEQSAPPPYGSQAVDVAHRLHGWLGLGLRGTIHF